MTTSACLWYNRSICPVSGERKLDFFSHDLREAFSKMCLSALDEDQEMMVDKEDNSNMARLTTYIVKNSFEDEKILLHNDPAYDKLTRIADMLVQSNPSMKLDTAQFYITTGQSSTSSATSFANHIILHENILKKNEDQLAFIIGHEMAHHALDHHSQRLSWICVEILVIVMLMLTIRRVLVLAILWILFDPFKMTVINPWTHQKELDADDLGMEMMARACFDVSEVLTYWEWNEMNNPSVNSKLSTHPSHSERKERVAEKMEKMKEIRNEVGCFDFDCFGRTMNVFRR